MNRILLFAGVIAASTSLSGCSWYWETSKEIGSYMPTYEGWFGDKKEQELAPAPDNQSSNTYYNYNNQNMTLNQAPQESRERRMPISGNPAGSYQPQPQPYSQSAPQGYPPFPPPPTGAYPPPPPRGGSLPYAGSFAPPEGFSGSEAPSDNSAPPPPPGFGNGAPDQSGPDPMAGLKNMQMQQQQGQQPLIPFTEPTLEDFAETITEEAPKEGGFFSDITDIIGGWFTSSDAPKKEFPNLANVPDASEYDTKMEASEEAKQELEADKEAAQEKQKTITDWSELAEEKPEDDSVVALSSITSPTGNEVVVPRDLPVEEKVMPEPKKQAESKAPETVVVMQKPEPMPEPQPMPTMEKTPAPVVEEAPAPAPIVMQEEQPLLETKPEFLRKPTLPSGVVLLPRNRYADRQ